MENIILGITLALSAYYDYREDRIPNVICALGSMMGLAAVFLLQGFSRGVEHCAWGLGAGLCFFPLWRGKMIGAGDVKLIMTGAVILGNKFTAFLLISGICIGFHAIVLMIGRKNYYKRMNLFFQYAMECWIQKQLKPYPFESKKDAKEGGIRISYGLFLGHLLAIVTGIYRH